MVRGHILIGTSGWSYDHWLGHFYPKGLAHEQWLEYYSKHFRSIEINNSFYQLPDKKILKHWYEITPDNFVFAAKASRYISHMKKLKGTEKNVATFLERISVLEDKLGPILFQLPPRWYFNEQRLAAFLNRLSREFRYTFEFRDRSWHNAQTYELLSQHKAAFCIYELDGFLSPKEVTTDFAYIRLHGPNGPYQGNYETRTLSGWASTFSTWSSLGCDVYCYFDNDQAGYAAQNALSLHSMFQN